MHQTTGALGVEESIDLNSSWNQYFEWFGPRYRLEVAENNLDGLNIEDGSLEKVRIIALEQLSQLPCVPSVGMQEIPRQSVGEDWGFGKDDSVGRDELGVRLAQHARYNYNIQGNADTRRLLKIRRRLLGLRRL